MTYQEDLIYFAGLFDGEGDIYINEFSGSFSLRVRLRMTQKEAVEDFAQFFGLTKPKIEEQKNENAKALWRGSAAGSKAKEILERLFPYLRVKKPQASLGIEFQEKRGEIPKSEQTRYKIEMMKLNRRGKDPN